MNRSMFFVLAIILSVETMAVDASDYESIQEAINQNPGGIVEITQPEVRISQSIQIHSDDTVLRGHARIVQENPKSTILVVEKAKGVRVEGLTFMRAEGAQEAEAPGIDIRESEDAVIDGVRVLNCKARHSAIHIQRAKNCRVRNSLIRNYKRIAVDDRTGSKLYGYAFKCIDGTGILVERSVDTVITDNRVVEDELIPTREVHERYGLGNLTDGQAPTNPGRLGKGAVERGWVSNWHQGSAIVVTSPADTRNTNVSRNMIRNAAQGIDLHCDLAIVEGNSIESCMVGLKATHGCHGLLIANNTIAKADLWGILVNPGAGSYAGDDDRAPNVDSNIIIMGNIITEFGYGHEYWNWGGRVDNGGGSYGIAIFEGQLAENPPLRDVIVTDNIVYDSGRDRGEKPRYRLTVYIGPWSEGSANGPTIPEGLHFRNNQFHPGIEGVCNVELP